METHDVPQQPARRNFIKKTCAVFVGAVTGLVPAISGLIVFLDPLRRKSQESDAVLVASLSSLRADGVPIVRPDPQRGVMFQDYALFPWRTVLGNVEFGPLARGATLDSRRSTARRYIELVGLTGFEERYPHELSGGMRQRCALARLLANEPEIWLMDEPLAAVDLQTRNILQDELLRLWGDEADIAARRAVLFVTHGIDEAVYLSDRVIVLSRRPNSGNRAVPRVVKPVPKRRTIQPMLPGFDGEW